jgi:hypothetical protein
MLERGIASTTLEFKISLVRAITLETGQIRAEGKDPQLRPSGRYGRRPRHRRQVLIASARYYDVPHFSELTTASQAAS